MRNKKQKPDLEQRVFFFIRDNKLITAGQKVLVAVSGGPDSVSLLHILYRLQSELKITLHIAHLNHQLRGQESEADARNVAELARSLNVPVTIERRDVVHYQSEHSLSLEEAAREVRYSFLAETARSLGAEKVAVGHTRNDQVETILLHIIRGTGTQGLRGLQPCRTMEFSGHLLTVIRPFLNINREETEEYCSQFNLTTCLDASNFSLSMLRNRVRQELLPILRSYNPGIFESLLRVSQIAQVDLELLDSEAEKIWHKIVSRERSTFIFNKAGLLKLAPALQRHLLRKAIEESLGTLKDIEARHIEEVLDALRKPAGKQITLPEGLIFGIEYDRYWLSFSPDELVPFPQLQGEFDIIVPGETRVSGWTVEATVVPREKMPENLVAGETGIISACFDKDKVNGIIKMRARQRGDRFQPLGMSQLKKVGEFMLDAGIPKAWRNRVPIICSPRQIIWIAGWRIDERVKVTESTRQVLRLKMFFLPQALI